MIFKLNRIFKFWRIEVPIALPSLADRSISISAVLRILMLATFWGTIVLIPFRLRLLTLPRPQPPIYADFTDFILFASDFLLIVTLILWTISLGFKPGGIALGSFFLTGPLIGITLVSLFSALSSIDVGLSFYHLIRLILLFGFYLFVVNECRSFSWIITPVAIQVAMQSLIAIVQILGQHSIGLSLFGELELDPSWSGVSIVWAEGIRSLRAYGLTDHPNILGGCLAFGLILLASSYLTTKKGRTLLTAVFILGTLGLLYTFSRSAWLAFGIGIIVIAIWLVGIREYQQFRILIALMIASLIAVTPFIWHNLPYIGVRMNHQSSFTQNALENQAIGERLILNQIANEIFLTEPLTGVGVGAFPAALKIQRPDYPYNHQPAHVVLLNVAAETGVLGGLFYILIITSPWLALWINRHRLIITPHLMGACALLLATTVVGILDYYTWFLTPGRLWQWLAMGLWGTIYHRSLQGGNHA
jgi:O-antigen ligase